MDTLNAIHERMHKSVMQAGGRIDAIFFCPHAAEDKCECRKPKPGMLKQIGERYNTNLTGVPVVGDSMRDLVCAVAVGAQPYLVLTGKGEKTKTDPDLPPETQIFADLRALAARIAS